MRNHSGAWMHSHFIRTGFWNNIIFHNTCLCRCGLLPFFHLFYPGHVRICFLNEEDHWGNFRPKSRSFPTNNSPVLWGHWPDQASRPAGMPTCFDFTSYELNGGTLVSWATWEHWRLWASTEYSINVHLFLLMKQESMTLNSEWKDASSTYLSTMHNVCSIFSSGVRFLHNMWPHSWNKAITRNKLSFCIYFYVLSQKFVLGSVSLAMDF